MSNRFIDQRQTFHSLSGWLSNGTSSSVIAKPFLKSSVWRQVTNERDSFSRVIELNVPTCRVLDTPDLHFWISSTTRNVDLTLSRVLNTSYCRHTVLMPNECRAFRVLNKRKKSSYLSCDVTRDDLHLRRDLSKGRWFYQPMHSGKSIVHHRLILVK